MSTPFTTEKSAVFAPMPSASVENGHDAEPRRLGEPAQPVTQILQEHLAGTSQGMDGLRRSVSPFGQTIIDLRLLLLAVPLSHGPPHKRGNPRPKPSATGITG